VLKNEYDKGITRNKRKRARKIVE